jgi:DNA-binding CsgD family transcriptional regulator
VRLLPLQDDSAAASAAHERPAVLTRREREVLVLLADGHTYRSAGVALGLAPETVKTYTRDLYRVLGARSAAHAVSLGYRRGLLGGGD